MNLAITMKKSLKVKCKIGLKVLNEIYKRQNECISTLQHKIHEQRNEIDNFEHCQSNDLSGEYRLEKILNQKKSDNKRNQSSNSTPKNSLISLIRKKYILLYIHISNL